MGAPGEGPINLVPVVPVGPVTRYVYVNEEAKNASSETNKYSSVQDAIAAAQNGDTVLLSAGEHKGDTTMNIYKSITVQGVTFDTTSYSLNASAYANAKSKAFTVAMNAANAVLSNITIRHNPANLESVVIITRGGTKESSTDSPGCQLLNVIISSSGGSLERCVDINGVSNVTVTGCIFPTVTKGYTLSLSSVKGANIYNCVIPAGAWGSVGIYPTSYFSALVDKSSSGINLSTGNTFDGGVVNIQPENHASYKLAGAAGEAQVTLPDSFKYAILLQGRVTGSSDNAGEENVRISNNAQLSAAEYTALQSATDAAFKAYGIAAGGRLVMYGRNLATGAKYFNAPFYNAENKAYAGVGASTLNVFVNEAAKNASEEPLSYHTVPSAIEAALPGDTVLLSDGAHEAAAQITMNKSITVRGASMTATSYTNTTATGQFTVVMSRANAVLRDITIKQKSTNTSTPINIARESYATDAAGCKLINVTLAAESGGSLARSLSINGVSNVTVTDCVFPAVTAGYTIGLSSVRGAVISGCTIPVGDYGSVGVFASNPGAFGAGGPLAADQLVSNGINISDNTWTGNGASGIVNIQPSSYASWKLKSAAGEAAVTLPDSFKYAILLQGRVTGSSDNAGPENVRISNNAQLSAAEYTTLQSKADTAFKTYGVAAGGRLVMYGRNLETSKVFYDATFDSVDNWNYGGAGAAAATSAALSSALTAPGATNETKQAAAVTAVTETFASIDLTNTTAAQALPAVAALLSSVSTNPEATSNVVVGLLENSNSAYQGAANGLSLKTAVAQAVENLPEIDLTSTQKDSFLSKIKTGAGADTGKFGVSTTLTGDLTIVPALSRTVGGQVERYILRSSSKVAALDGNEYTPMIPGVWYSLLLKSEVDGTGAPKPPVGVTLSQLKYENDALSFRVSPAAASESKKLDDTYSIVRGSDKYVFKVVVIGSDAGQGNGLVPCIPAGQRILTAAGWRAVEDLKDGDMVITDSGAAVPAEIYASTVITTRDTAPINIPVKLFGKTGNASVRLSPNHAVRLNKNVWQFPCHLLKRNSSVTQDAPGQKVSYYHIALPNYLRDNLVLEGGVVAESYGVPFLKSNKLSGAKFYNYNTRLDGFTRTSYGSVAHKTA